MGRQNLEQQKIEQQNRADNRQFAMQTMEFAVRNPQFMDGIIMYTGMQYKHEERMKQIEYYGSYRRYDDDEDDVL